MTGPLVLGTPDYLDVRWPANVTVLKQMAELGLKKTLFGSVNFFNTKLVERAGALLGVPAVKASIRLIKTGMASPFDRKG